MTTHIPRQITSTGVSLAEEGNDKNIKAVRIPNLIAICTQLQESLYSLAFPWDVSIKKGENSLQAGLIEHIQSLGNEVEKACAHASTSPMELPARSRNAYQWLKFLSDEGRLQSYLDALQIAYAACQGINCRRKGPPSLRRRPVKIHFYNLNALYRVSFRSDVIFIQANEGFIDAPPPVIEALIQAALCLDGRQSLALVRQYADSAEYGRSLQMLTNSAAQPPNEVKGKVHDLEESFVRVNQAYFNGRMEQPHLTWNRTMTYRKLGHYQPNTDTVQISLTLDQIAVPEFILDYVMYHELLHKHLGIHYKNGRRAAHTPLFRSEEKKYRFYNEAQEFVNQIGQRLTAKTKSRRQSTAKKIRGRRF